MVTPGNLPNCVLQMRDDDGTRSERISTGSDSTSTRGVESATMTIVRSERNLRITSVLTEKYN